MKAKRDDGLFAMEKRGNKWSCQVNLGVHPVSGKRLRKRFNADSKKEAYRMANEYYQQHQRGIDIDGGDSLLRDYLDKWFITWQSKRELKESSVRRYSEQINILNETLGDTPINMITPLHLDQLIRANPNLKSMHKSYAIMKRAFEDAIRYDLLIMSPFWKHDAPKKPKRKEPVFLTEKEIGLLTAELHGNWIQELVLFALSTGARVGELIGLEWNDVEWDETDPINRPGTITIRRSIRTNTAGKYVRSEPKTVNGYRTIELSGKIMKMLSDKAVKNEARKIIAGRWVDLGVELIFPNRAGGYHSGSNLLKEFKRVAKQAGITKHVYLHALRHTSATLAIKNGTDIHTLKNRLGHENISITSDLYAHLYTGQQQAAAEMMDVYLDS